MNILFFYESMALGGQQNYNYQLVRRFAELGHKVSWAYLFGEDLKDLVTQSATVYHVPYRLGPKDYIKRPWRLLQITKAVMDFAKSQNSQVILSGSGIGSLICGLVARRLGIPHYRIIGCSLVQVEPTLFRLYSLIRIDRLIDGYFGWPRVFEELSSKGVHPDKFIEVNNTVDTEMYFPFTDSERLDLRSTLGIASDELVIGWVGRIAYDMQVKYTLELAVELNKKGFNKFRLLIVGGGPWEEELRRLIDENGLASRTIFTGWVPMHDVNGLLNAMDVVPLLEVDPQGGSIVREAMASGRVALSVDGVSGTQRRFMQPGCSILVPSENFTTNAADAIIKLDKEPESIPEIGHNARQFALGHMSWDEVVRIKLRTLEGAIR